MLSPLVPHPDEVDEVEWTTAGELSTATTAAPWAFSPWLVAHLPGLVPHLAEAEARRHA
jgi:isopentenyl-diphosphate delta-isomerase